MPAWLQAHLEATGALDSDGVGRTIRAATCRCGRTVIRGLDARAAALAVTADPTPVSQLGEAAALIAGASTYDLIPHGQRFELNHRDSWRIRGMRRYPVLAEHRCGITWPADTTPVAIRGSKALPTKAPF